MRIPVPILALCAVWTLAAAPDNLSSVLQRVDRAAAGFKGMSADVRRAYHTAVLNDDTVDSGTMLIRRSRPKEVKMLIRLTQPDPRTAAVDGRKAELYFPKMNTVQEF